MKTTITIIGIVLFLLLQLGLFFQMAHVGDHLKAQKRRASSHEEMEQLSTMLDLVNRYSKVTGDASQSSTAAVLYTKELNKKLAPEAAIEFYTKLVPEVRDEAARRAIRFELVDLYTRGSKPDRDKALEQLRILMTSSPQSPDGSPGSSFSPPATRPTGGP